MSRFLLPLLVLISSAALTVVISLFAHARAEAQQQADFDDVMRERKTAVAAQLHNCELALRGAQGLFSASKSVERGEWSSYVRGMAISENFRGVHGMVYIEYVSGDGLGKFLADTRADEAPQFNVTPAGTRSEYRVIKFVEPAQENNGALGFDSATVPDAQDAQNRARDTGEPAMSAPLKLVQSQGGPGVVIYLPVYANGKPTATIDQRRAALQGWVAAPLRVDTMLHEVFGPAHVPLRLNAMDATAGKAAPLHEITPDENRSEGDAFSGTENVVFGGRTWKLELAIAPEFAATAPDMTLRAIVAGTVISLLLFGITLSLTTTRARALTLAKNMTQALRTSEERFRAMIEHSSDNITIIDAEGKATFESPSVEAMVGYKPEELVGKNSMKNIHPEDVPTAAAVIERAFGQPGTVHGLTYRIQHKDGSWRVLETVGRVIADEDGNPVAVLNSRDVTERKRAEEALRQSEQRFDLAVQGSAVGIWDTQVNGANWRESFVPESPVYWSPRIAEMWGVDYADLPHTLKPWIERVHPDDAARVFQAVTEHIDHRKPYCVELRMRHASGEYRWFQSRAEVYRDENGVPTRMAGSLIDISEHKHAEEVLRLGEAAQREAAQLQRDVLNALPANVALLNRQGEIMAVSESWREFGRNNELQSADSCVGSNYIALCDNAVGQDSAEAAHVAAGIRAVIAGQSNLFALQYSCHSPWDKRWFRLMVAPVERAGERGCVIMHVDVTERVQAELALERNAAKLAEAQRIGGVGSFEMNLETFAVNWSDEAYRIYGVERSDKPLTFDTFLAIVHPDDAAKIREATETALKTGLSFEIEHRVVHADKSVHFIHSHVEVVRSPEGKPILLTGTNEDITQRKETELEIRLGALKLAEAQRIGRVGSFEQDIERKTAVWSDETYRIMGIDKKASPARFEDFMERVHPDDRGLIFQTINEATLSHKTAVLEFRIIRKDAEVAFLRSHIEVTFSPDGKPVKFSGTCQDITEQKQAESQLADNARVLKEKNTQLDVALVQANEATRLKGEFLANMSHEIRTPMNGVIGMTGLLLETALTQEQKEYAEIIRNSGEALLCIINDILDFSKIEAGKLKLEPVEFDMQQAVHDVAELLAKGAQDKGLELLVRFERDCPRRIVADPGRMRQVLLNLMGNGVKFTKKGHVLVEVSASAGKDPGSTRLKVSVQDTGIGMAADKIPHVFEKFFQADASTTRVFGGTGLGLPICKQLVELMGGEILVESELGKGTTVSFEIEVPRGAASEEEARVNSLPKDIRALVVDDDEVARRVLSQLCASFGMKCDTADSGMEALTKMRAAATQGAPYTLALLDMRMPLMDGAQLARTIKKDEQLKSTRLAIVSAFTRPDDSTLPIGMVEAVLTKPVRADVLLPVLTRMFRTNQGATTTTSIKPRVDSGSGLLGGKRVLVAEDNAVNQKLVSRMLEKLGCKFDMAGNGKEAVGMALNMHYDLVLMDCQMPELDGYDATREIRRRMGHQRLPIVAMTANAMQGDRDKCLAAGMDDYISKPMKFEDVRDTLTRWLIVAPGQATVERMTPRHVVSN